MRLSAVAPGQLHDPFAGFDQTFEARLREADEFYQAITPPQVGEDEANVMRQALAGMLWSKQYYFLEADKWLEEHGVDPMQTATRQVRNSEWVHMINDHVISMPDKWEYPWYAAWDLAFHAIALSTVDVDFAKEQLELMLREIYLHPSGQIPAYEWNFSDVNPPVHAWATIFLHRTEEALRGEGDLAFLKRAFGKLMLNFNWWVNRKDRFGKNVFEGGFLGLDNIGVFDRSAPLPTGGYLEQADGTAWMALFCQNMMEICFQLAAHDSDYDDLAAKFGDHFLWIAHAMNRMGPDGMWDEEDGFYYDVLRLPDGTATRLKVRSMVGLLPVCATTVVEPWQRERMPHYLELFAVRLRRMPWLLQSIHPTGPGHFGVAGRGIAALVGPDRLRRILSRMLDESEFLSPYGIRAVSRYHAEHPYVFRVQGQEYRVDYLPAESNTGMFGGNSNWRGPIWMPVNVMLIRALLQFYLYYGDNFKIECPTGSGNLMNLFEVSKEISTRLQRIFLRDESGPAPGVRGYGEVPDRSPLEGSPAVPRVLPRRQRGGPGGQPSDGLDGVGRRNSSSFTAIWIQRRCLKPDEPRRSCVRAGPESGGDSTISWTLARTRSMKSTPRFGSINHAECGARSEPLLRSVHPVIRIVLLIILALVSSGGTAPGQQASGSPAKPNPAPTPIPLAKVPLEAQSALTSLQEIDANVSRDQSSADGIARTLSDLTSEIDARIADDTRLLTTSPSLDMLYRLKLAWENFGVRLSVSARELTRARHKSGRATRASGSVEQDLAGNAPIGETARNAPASLAAGAECSRLH